MCRRQAENQAASCSSLVSKLRSRVVPGFSSAGLPPSVTSLALANGGAASRWGSCCFAGRLPRLATSDKRLVHSSVAPRPPCTSIEVMPHSIVDALPEATETCYPGPVIAVVGWPHPQRVPRKSAVHHPAHTKDQSSDSAHSSAREMMSSLKEATRAPGRKAGWHRLLQTTSPGRVLRMSAECVRCPLLPRMSTPAEGTSEGHRQRRPHPYGVTRS